MPEFLVVVIVLAGLLAVISGVVFVSSDTARGGLGFVIGAVVGLAAVIILVVGGSFWAGAGDAPASAEAWVKEWRPGAKVECQKRDTDGNGYVSCTVGFERNGEREVESIECGVNRWYHGFNTSGCRLTKGYAGSQ